MRLKAAAQGGRRHSRPLVSRGALSALALGLAAFVPKDSAARSRIVAFTCAIEKAEYRGSGVPWTWRFWKRESFVVDLRRLRPYGDGSCCRVDTPRYTIAVTPDAYAFASRQFAREQFRIDHATLALDGTDTSGAFIRGTCRRSTRSD